MSERQLKEFLKSMERIRKLNATSPKKARKFLREEGVLTASGKHSRALGFSWTPNCDENESEITRRCV